jgi:hypothetical protein
MAAAYRPHVAARDEVGGDGARVGRPWSVSVWGGLYVTDYSKHTDEQLREGIERAEEQDPRIATESSDEALEAERRQHDEMTEELERREP